VEQTGSTITVSDRNNRPRALSLHHFNEILRKFHPIFAVGGTVVAISHPGEVWSDDTAAIREPGSHGIPPMRVPPKAVDEEESRLVDIVATAHQIMNPGAPPCDETGCSGPRQGVPEPVVAGPLPCIECLLHDVGSLAYEVGFALFAERVDGLLMV